jgi:hypothetical protein
MSDLDIVQAASKRMSENPEMMVMLQPFAIIMAVARNL